MSNELKPCQCGNTKVSFTECNYGSLGFLRGVICYECGLFLDSRKKTLEEAAKIWNNRPREDALRAEIETLKHLVNNLQQQLYFKNLAAAGVEG